MITIQDLPRVCETSMAVGQFAEQNGDAAIPALGEVLIPDGRLGWCTTKRGRQSMDHQPSAGRPQYS